MIRYHYLHVYPTQCKACSSFPVWAGSGDAIISGSYRDADSAGSLLWHSACVSVYEYSTLVRLIAATIAIVGRSLVQIESTPFPGPKEKTKCKSHGTFDCLAYLYFDHKSQLLQNPPGLHFLRPSAPKSPHDFSYIKSSDLILVFV